MWRLTDIQLGYELALTEVGNCKQGRTVTFLRRIKRKLFSL